MKVYDNLFDSVWINQLHDKLVYDTKWRPTTVANASSWPSGEMGSHLIMGALLFHRINDSDDLIAFYDGDVEDTHKLIGAWYHILNVAGRNLRLQQISANLQFKDMNQSAHTDHFDWNYVLMVGRVDEDVTGGEFVNETTGEVVEYKSGRVIEIDNKEKHYGKGFDTPNVSRFTVRMSGNEYRTNRNRME